MKYSTRTEYLAALPKRHAAAGALFLNAHNEVLIVKPFYKEKWSIPGGVIEHGEWPTVTVMREINEEIGITICLSRLLVIDSTSPSPDNNGTGSYQFVFDGGQLSDAQIAAIKLCSDEIESYRFADIETALQLLSNFSAPRVKAAYQAHFENKMYYLEHGQIV